MCGRFTQKYTWEELHQLYRLTQPARNLRPRYNICPTDPVDVVIRGDGRLLVVPMRWQLIPPWWKKPLKELPATFNARAETIAEKPMFRDAFRRTRCLIPASGYYEWAIKAVGNYGEVFDKNLGAASQLKLSRGLNGLWTQGGLMYAIPYR